jgi:hypothetical protein
MMDTESLRKSKPESLEPCTSNAFDEEMEAKDDWELAWLRVACSATESRSRDANRFLVAKWWIQNLWEINAFDEETEAKDDWELAWLRVACSAMETSSQVTRFDFLVAKWWIPTLWENPSWNVVEHVPSHDYYHAHKAK